MRKLKIEVVGPEEDYPSYTCYLWLLEAKDLIEEDFDVKVNVRWERNEEKLSSYNYFPVLLIEGKKALLASLVKLDFCTKLLGVS